MRKWRRVVSAAYEGNVVPFVAQLVYGWVYIECGHQACRALRLKMIKNPMWAMSSSLPIASIHDKNDATYWTSKDLPRLVTERPLQNKNGRNARTADSLGRENETITIVNLATVNVKECYLTVVLAYIKLVDFRMIALALPL